MRVSSSLLASVALAALTVACTSASDGDEPVDPQLLAVSVESGVPAEVLAAVPDVPGHDLASFASVVSDCAAATEVSGDALADWVPALDCYDQLQVELADVIHAHGGVARSANEVAWDGGVTLTIPVRGTSVTSCSAGRVCFYENRDFGGRRLSFADKGIQFFDAYGFRDKVSSWKNRATTKVEAWNDTRIVHAIEVLWTENAGTQSSWVGSRANDKADSFKRF